MADTKTAPAVPATPATPAKPAAPAAPPAPKQEPIVPIKDPNTGQAIDRSARPEKKK
jgi:hypothetical protein